MKNRLMRWRLVTVVAVSCWCGGRLLARDYLDTLAGCGWSPNSVWVAINWPQRDELLFISTKTKVNYLLKPVGARDLEMQGVFTGTNAPVSVKPAIVHGSLKTIPSFGTTRLTMEEWSPDNTMAAYHADAQQRVVFSLDDGTVLRRMSDFQPLPWQNGTDLRTRLVRLPSGGYRLRCAQLDGTVVKDVVFENQREIAQISLARYNGANFGSSDGRYLLYPRYSENSWELIWEATQPAGPRRQLHCFGETPIAWCLTTSNTVLAVATGKSLIVGAIAAWDQAQRIPLGAADVDLNWSPNGRFLAYQTGRALHVLPLGSDQPVRVTPECTPMFWGWRGTRLLFGKPSAGMGNVYYVDADHLGVPVQIITGRPWKSAPSEISVSPDGTRMVCVVMEIDGAGNPVQELWQIRLSPDAEWEQIYSFGE